MYALLRPTGLTDARIEGQRLTIAAQEIPTLKQCPAPSRVFTGREDVLRQMELYFTNGKRTQHIFVLYGLGGGGKSQIAFKFVDQSQFETEPSRCVTFLHPNESLATLLTLIVYLDFLRYYLSTQAQIPH